MKKVKSFLFSILALSLACFTACEMNFGGDPFNSRLEEEYPSASTESLESTVIESDGSEDSTLTSEESSEGESSIASLSIHFLELGNKYTGDCTLIKVGDTEVLIDAGSRKGSAKTIVPYVQQYCTDGVLEYVIATHAHQDHIAGFVGTSTEKGIFESFVCETIIDYPLTEVTSQIRTNYENLRKEEVQKGAKHYTALECWNNQNGAQRSYTLGAGVTMNILYQKYYEEDASDENDYSVCMLLSQGDKHYLFTGDLEKHGEQSLVGSNDLPDCVLFKGGHHGSPTSNTPALLSVIKPDIVCVCCCCGSDEYTSNVANMFPSQAFVDNVAPYTDKVYVTTMVATGTAGYQSMNGNIVLSSNGGEVTVNCSNNNTLFKDTDWFKANRTMPNAWK
nr:MBL fold metallo-hydrolase [Clostridia bacterium]